MLFIHVRFFRKLRKIGTSAPNNQHAKAENPRQVCAGSRKNDFTPDLIVHIPMFQKVVRALLTARSRPASSVSNAGEYKKSGLCV